jgi:hypothetical protein
MRCRVCNGSGISPASSHPYAMREGIVLNCGACHGTGVRTPPGGDEEPDPYRSGALEAASAFQRHLDQISADRPATYLEPDTGDDLPSTAFRTTVAISALDRRIADEMAETIQGRTDRETVRRLEEIVADLKRLDRVDRALLGSDEHAVKRRLANATKMLARARANLDDMEGAELDYMAASSLYDDVGMSSECYDCRDRISEVRFAMDRDVDERLAYLNRKLARVTEPIALAEAHVDIADLHGAAGDEYEATSHFREAERIAAPLADSASGAAMADALFSSMRAVIAGDGSEPRKQPVVEANRVRAVLRQIYAGLARVLPEPEAAQYRRRGARLDGTIADGNRDNIEFSERMQASLGDLIEEINRRYSSDQ